MDLFKDVLPSLNLKTSHLLDENLEAEKLYNSFMVNRAYAQGEDTVLYSNFLNRFYDLDKRLQYDFYFYGLEKAKRFNKWAKMEELNNLEIVKEYFKCSSRTAKDYLRILTQDHIDLIKKKLFKGGVSR